MLLCQFVDAIEANPGILFDFHDGENTKVLNRSTVIGQPDLNLAFTASMLVDGGVVGPSAYGLRRLTLLVQITTADIDTGYGIVAGLFRELDRPVNLLRWQPDGVAYPVFFETIRTQPGDVNISNSAVGIWEVEVAILAYPFAKGRQVAKGPFTVNNDPAAATNPCRFDVTGVIGDVPTPMVLVDTSAMAGMYLAKRSRGVPGDLTFIYQAESASLDVDTTNPGGGPDPVMSGSGTNNFVRTSFATDATLQTRLTITVPGSTLAQRQASPGTYRVLAIVRISGGGGGSDFRLAVATDTFQGDSTVIPSAYASNRQVCDLGLVSIGPPVSRVGYGSALAMAGGFDLFLLAARDAGSDTLDWDCIVLLPADEGQALFPGPRNTSVDGVIDGYSDTAFLLLAGDDPFTNGGAFTNVLPLAGSVPKLTPGATNRLYALRTTGVPPEPADLDKNTSETFMIYFWPLYLNVRPASS